MGNFRSALIDERGASLVEYGILVALIAIVAFAAVQFFGIELTALYEESGTTLMELNR